MSWKAVEKAEWNVPLGFTTVFVAAGKPTGIHGRWLGYYYTGLNRQQAGHLDKVKEVDHAYRAGKTALEVYRIPFSSMNEKGASTNYFISSYEWN